MPFSYNPLWKLLIDKGMTKEKLRIALQMSPTTIARMGRNEYISMELLDKICKYFDVGLDSIVEYLPESEQKQSPNPK